MTGAFTDEYLDENVQGLPCQVQPRFSTRIVLAKSGAEVRNQNWQQPLRKFMLPQAVCDPEDLELVQTFWLTMGGPYSAWPFRDPTEFASCALVEQNVVPNYTGSDQALGVGDGLTSAFQLNKVRTLGANSFTRTIVLPIVDTIEVLINGMPPADVPSLQGGPYTVESISRPGGIVTISPAPHAGLTLTWGGLFDTLVRFEADDTFDAIMHSFTTGGSSALNFIEVRNC